MQQIMYNYKQNKFSFHIIIVRANIGVKNYNLIDIPDGNVKPINFISLSLMCYKIHKTDGARKRFHVQMCNKIGDHKRRYHKMAIRLTAKQKKKNKK